MAPKADDSVLDGAWLVIQNNSTQMRVCAGEPADFADTLTRRLAEVAMTPGDYTIANGDTSGRKVTAAGKTNVPITATGAADHVAHNDVTNTLLLYVFEAANTGLTSGNQVNIGSHRAEILDPVVG